MQKFCTACGSQLDGINPCSCQEETKSTNGPVETVESKSAQPFESSVDTEQIKNYLSRLMSCLISGLKKPVTTAQYIVKSSSVDLAIGLLVLSWITTMLLVTIFSSATISGAGLSWLLGDVKGAIGAITFKLACYGNALPTLLFAITLMIAQLIWVKKIDFKGLVVICGASQIMIIFIQILMLSALIYFPFFMPLLLCGNIAGLFVVYEAIKERYALKADGALWMTMATTLGSILLSGYIAINFFETWIDRLSYFFY